MATTPVFLPGKSHEQRSLVGYSPWGHKKLDMTEHAHPYFFPKEYSIKEGQVVLEKLYREET